MTRDDSTSPCSTVVRRWIDVIGDKLGIVVVYSHRLHTMLKNRANFLRRHFKQLTGGSSRRKFLQKSWELKLEKKEVKPQVEQSLRAKLKEAYGTIEKLKEGKKQLQHKVCSYNVR